MSDRRLSAARRACGLALAAMLAALGSAAAAERIDCPASVAYDFALSSGRASVEAGADWSVSLHRAEGARTAGLPKLSVRGGELRCEYELPNGAFALARRPAQGGAEACRIAEDDAFSIPYFLCE